MCVCFFWRILIMNFENECKLTTRGNEVTGEENYIIFFYIMNMKCVINYWEGPNLSKYKSALQFHQNLLTTQV